MTDLTIGLIYSIKANTASWDKAVADFMARHTTADIKEFNDATYYCILKQAFLDYLATCDRPDKDVYMYMSIMECNPMWSGAHQIADALICTTVRTDLGKYVNGFRKLPDFENRVIEFDMKRMMGYTFEYSSPYMDGREEME